jgi:hypothetical protein
MPITNTQSDYSNIIDTGWALWLPLKAKRNFISKRRWMRLKG